MAMVGGLMRALTSKIVAIGALLVQAPASAQTYDPKYPVCMHVYGEQMGDRMDCIFASLAQCKATASGLPALCLVNPYYAAAPRYPAKRARALRLRGDRGS